MDRAEVFAGLRRRGWAVSERVGPLRQPQPVVARHAVLPTTLTDFLGGLEACEDAEQRAWFLSEADYAGTSGSAFLWDEWERMSLDAAGDDAQLAGEVRAFWDAHLPFILSVRDGYAYFAIRTVADGFGRVVTGREPEFEFASVVADSFEEFMTLVISGRLRP